MGAARALYAVLYAPETLSRPRVEAGQGGTKVFKRPGYRPEGETYLKHIQLG